jgi:hypothetical protein
MSLPGYAPDAARLKSVSLGASRRAWACADTAQKAKGSLAKSKLLARDTAITA